MKKFHLLLCLFSCVLLIQSCDRKNNETIIQQDPGEAITDADILKANNDFAFDIFKEVSKVETEENYMISPVSLSLALGMSYNGTAGDTKIAFQNTLKFGNPNTDQLNEINKTLIDDLTDESDGSLFKIANSIWASEIFPLKESFVEISRDYYSAEAQTLDFNDPSSVEIINNWVAENTNNKIPEILNSTDDLMYLINAIYFNANWKYEFDPEDTQTASFNNSPQSEPIEVEMMYMQTELQYLITASFSSVILPYKNDRFQMVLMRPRENFTTNDLIEEMNNENWKSWMGSYEAKELRVHLPKFKFDYENELRNELSQLGLGIAFNGAADFSNLSDQESFISSVLQKCFITVDETGTEAAAATSISNNNSAPPTVNLNKPFVVAITNNSTGSICFIGRVGNPEFD